MCRRITKGKKTDYQKLESIFYYVRDEIKFAFLKKADLMMASEVIKAKSGPCNNKSVLFKALCKGTGLETRVRFSTIKKEIHHGLFTGLIFILMPKEISHS